MFHVKIKIKESHLHGLGLYADEDIKQHQKIFTESPNLALYFSAEQFLSLPENDKALVKHYGFFDIQKNQWHLSFEDIRFCNHSSNSSITLSNDSLIAKRDIHQGEELTQDYSEFEDLREELKNRI